MGERSGGAHTQVLHASPHERAQASREELLVRQVPELRERVPDDDDIPIVQRIGVPEAQAVVRDIQIGLVAVRLRNGAGGQDLSDPVVRTLAPEENFSHGHRRKAVEYWAALHEIRLPPEIVPDQAAADLETQRRDHRGDRRKEKAGEPHSPEPPCAATRTL